MSTGQGQTRRSVNGSRDEAHQEVFDYIEMLDNPKRKHVGNGGSPSVGFEKHQILPYVFR